MALIAIPILAQCPFCAAFDGLNPYPVAAENAQAVAMVTAEQRGDPHVLIVTRRHAPTILELDGSELAAVMLLAQQTAEAIVRLYDVDGISIWQNNGKRANQSVPHFHLHVAAPIEEGGVRWWPVEKVEMEVREAIAARLREGLTPLSEH